MALPLSYIIGSIVGILVFAIIVGVIIGSLYFLRHRKKVTKGIPDKMKTYEKMKGGIENEQTKNGEEGRRGETRGSTIGNDRITGGGGRRDSNDTNKLGAIDNGFDNEVQVQLATSASEHKRPPDRINKGVKKDWPSFS